MASTHLPIKVKKVGGGYRISFGKDGVEAYIYAHEKRVAPSGLDWTEAEAFAKKIARTLSEAWSTD